MPSPFPGMDPYLEDPDLWPDVHATLISELQAELNRLLRPNYVARVEQRVFVSDGDDADLIIPDVRVVAGPRPTAARRLNRGTATMAATGPAAATATIEPVDVTTDPDDPEMIEVRHRFLRVVDARDRSVVTVIEVLSPSNKVRGSAGRRSFLDKRAEITSSLANWVGIDLLRAGARMAVRERLPAHDYRVDVSRAGGHDGDRRQEKAWPIPLAFPLPTIPIPLRSGTDVAVDLQAVLGRAYERGAYDVDTDYDADPIPPLTGDTADWARARVAAWRAGAASTG
jgi:hypothetical protein